MKKVLIISYYFPPCNLTGSNRISSWAEYLHFSGYHPIIITRNWDNTIVQSEDLLRSSGSSVKKEENEHFTVHYLPYTASLRDRLFTSNKTWGKSLSKVLTLINLIAQNSNISSSSYWNLYEYSAALIKRDKSIKKVIISGDPFMQFKFGYLLQKRFGIKWIADYRDGWNTQELEIKKGFLHRFIRILECKSEKKWVQSASYITSVSDSYTNKISHFVNVKGETIHNGYFDNDRIFGEQPPNKNLFTIAYSGALYNSQNIDIFLDGFKKFIDLSEKQSKCLLHFIGLNYDLKQKNRVEERMKGYENYVKCGSRVSRIESLIQLSQAHMHFLTSYSNHKGVPTSKVFDYLALGRPIILCPSDNDIIERIVLESGKGIIANTSEEVTSILQDHYKNFLEGTDNEISIKRSNNLAQFSRKNSTAKLATLLDQL